MKLVKTLFMQWLLLVTFFSAMYSVQAQPSTAKIIKDITSPGVLSAKLVGKGRKVWSSSSMQYTWDQTAVVVRKAGIPEFPNAKLEVGGIASYSIVAGRFIFKQFYVTYNSYTGIPAPSGQTVISLLKKDLPKFLGYRYNTVVGDIDPILLAAQPQWNWHTPNSVSCLVTTAFTEKTTPVLTEKKRVVYEVRLYRDAIKAPWKDFFATSKEEQSLGKTTHEADDLAAMKTLSVVDAERASNARLAALPQVEIPSFKTDLELFSYLHKMMREGDAGTLEAVLRKTFSPRYFEPNSNVVLNGVGEELLRNTLKMVFGSKAKYVDQYGPNPNVKERYKNQIWIWNADGRHFSRIRVEPSGGEYKDGVKINQEFKIFELEIWVVSDADTVARLNSMSPEKRFAPLPGYQTLSQLEP